MRKIATDICWQRMDQASKDKQTLVLFLLGFCLVITPLLFSQILPIEQEYTWVQESESNTWQIVSTMRSKLVQEGRLDQTDARQQSLQLLKTIPPALALFFNQPLSLQECRQQDLEMLPGIGPRVASAIIATRQKKGRLSSAEDLLDVPGVGPSVLQRILPLVSFE
jgi:competence ComEA-like helix-hairpin-helix protein